MLKSLNSDLIKGLSKEQVDKLASSGAAAKPYLKAVVEVLKKQIEVLKEELVELARAYTISHDARAERSSYIAAEINALSKLIKLIQPR